jgi:2-oxoglutarate ferredoxin oxidoreductase subunit alpha
VLSDQLFSDSYSTIDDFDLSRIAVGDRREAAGDFQAPYTYQRYAATGDAYSVNRQDAENAKRNPESGVVHGRPNGDAPPPRLLPGFPNQLVVSASHEHSTSGHITESAADRTQMMDRRLGKLKPMREEMDGMTIHPPPLDPLTENRHSSFVIRDSPDPLLLCFGSTLGAVREAVDVLRQQGVNAGMLHLSELAPFPAQLLTEQAARSRRLITVENNATAQLAQLIHAETRLHIADSILKFDGRPFTSSEVISRYAVGGRR